MANFLVIAANTCAGACAHLRYAEVKRFALITKLEELTTEIEALLK